MWRDGRWSSRGGRRLRAGFLSSVMVALCALLGTGVRAQTEQDDSGDPHAQHDPFGHDEVSPKFSLHGFADVTASGERTRSATGQSSSQDSFARGGLDLYLVSRLAENISFLGEVLFEDETIQGQEEQKVDVERMSIKYTLSDRFWIALGRHHTALGYWNEAYHHGRLLQPTVERPEFLKFEDLGGILPVHTVGLAVGGGFFRGPWGLDYTGQVSNNRGITSQDVVNSGDSKDQKAFTGRLSVSREGDRRLVFGPTAHFGFIPPDPTIPGREGEMQERIYGAHLIYRADRFEWLSEYYRVRHEDQKTSQRFDHTAYYGIGVLRAGKWKPYGGLDRLELDAADLFYAGSATTLKRYLLGIRWDLHPLNALKFEYHHDRRPGVRTDALIVQTSFTF